MIEITNTAIALAGFWAFALATVISKEVTGWAMTLAYIIAIIATMLLV